jgi:hypothetical protein
MPGSASREELNAGNQALQDAQSLQYNGHIVERQPGRPPQGTSNAYRSGLLLASDVRIFAVAGDAGYARIDSIGCIHRLILRLNGHTYSSALRAVYTPVYTNTLDVWCRSKARRHGLGISRSRQKLVAAWLRWRRDGKELPGRLLSWSHIALGQVRRVTYQQRPARPVERAAARPLHSERREHLDTGSDVRGGVQRPCGLKPEMCT